jgi:DNA mismatch repair protein MutH
MRAPTPTSEIELLSRADALAGRRLGDLADSLGLFTPPDLRRHKGWIGDLAEHVLGVPGSEANGPDFAALGVELKTIPLNERGRPRESTWVCTCPMRSLDLGPWDRSLVRRKLARVLWVPVLGAGPPGDRRFGVPLMWSPTAEQEQTLAEDWGVLAELVSEGEVWQWTAHHGEALQLRPKAARSSDWVWVVDRDGEWCQTTPLGFYLRARFTAGVIAEQPQLVPAR